MDSVKQPPQGCPSDTMVRHLAGQWTPHIVHRLGEGGPIGFNALQRALAGVTPKVLSQRLKALEADGVVWRTEEPTVPPRTHYGLTERGQQLHTLLKQFDHRAAAPPSSADGEHSA